ncbi:hypothetical protein A1sIA53_00200 [Candidatus Planktophila dulcis]|uniref:SGNH hydrolase domain-containing protein n=1 Tax=Candidatus Planktophila dulcis TaxID=1884914 RepID=UPI000BAC4E92|nr:SGNH hydrolase domain-containing protein [Candidatus Planktophila dulcis]ASY14017.1 hypothetical protein A1sIA53_00200 [Candidatus Planktophila dulcis]
MTPRIRKAIALYLTAFLTLITLVLLNNNLYFGFNGHIPIPEYAGYSDQNCDRTQIIQEPCQYKFADDSQSHEIALIGDSHAAGLSDVVVKSAQVRHANLDIWTRTGCKYVPASILTRMQLAYLKNNSGDCQERNSHFTREVTSKRYTDIVISWRSTNCDDNLFVETCSSEFVKLMDDTLNFLSRYSRVLVIGPTFEYSDREFLKPTLLFAKSKSPPKFVYRNRLIQETEIEAQLISQLRIKKVTNVDPRDTFCNQERCNLSIDGSWIMKDNNHLSRYGSILLLKPILAAIPMKVGE